MKNPLSEKKNMPSSCDTSVITNVANSSSTGEKLGMKFPYYASGEVVKGFGRGSKELGIPTANYPTSVVRYI
jgi:FAD synthase